MHINSYQPSGSAGISSCDGGGRSAAGARAASGGRGLQRDHASAGTADSTQDAAVGVSVDSNANLVVRTAEGDRVTISLAARTQLAAASHQDADGTTQVAELDNSSTYRITVKGSLNDAEVADLQKLIGALGEAAGQAQKAGTVDTTGLTKTLGDLHNVAAFQFQETQSVRTGVMMSRVAF